MLSPGAHFPVHIPWVNSLAAAWTHDQCREEIQQKVPYQVTKVQVAKVSYAKGSPLLRRSRPALRLLARHIFFPRSNRDSLHGWIPSTDRPTHTHKIKRSVSCSMSDEDLGRSDGKDSPEHVPGRGHRTWNEVCALDVHVICYLFGCGSQGRDLYGCMYVRHCAERVQAPMGSSDYLGSFDSFLHATSALFGTPKDSCLTFIYTKNERR